MAIKPLVECRLYGFVDTAYLRGRSPESVAMQLCDGGADLIQLRAKNESIDTIRKMAGAILPVTERAGVGLVMNDHPEIAVGVGAPWCHLGQEDFFDRGYAHVQELFSKEDKLHVGLSSHSPDQARRAVAAGADYIAIGPVYATGTKPSSTPVTLDYVRWAAANVTVPWFAIGGINRENIERVIEAGARRVCIVSAILNAQDIVLACQEFKRLLTSHALTKSA